MDGVVSGDLDGQSVGRYVVGRLIGRGGMGEVFLGMDPVLRREVVVKRLHPALDPSRSRAQRLRREAQIQSRLEHANIVRIYDYVTVDGADYIVSEYVDGGTLRAHAQGTKLTLRAALEILLQIARALAFSHAHGIIHRDLKTENVLLTSDGIIKVTDFGLSRSLDHGGQGRDSDGALGGTLFAMAPEQLRGEEATPRSDLYSFGVLAYELLSGRPPFEGRTPFEVMQNLLGGKYSPLRTVLPRAPLTLSELLDHTLARAPDARPESFEEVIARLERAQAEVGLSDASVGARYELRHVAAVCLRLVPPELDPSTGPSLRPLLEAHVRARALFGEATAMVASSAGLEIVACVGYPRSHDRNACTAASLAAGLRSALADQGTGVGLAVGIDVGEVAFGSADGASVVVGAAVERARELARRALRQQLLVAPIARSQLVAGGFSLRPVADAARPEVAVAYEVEPAEAMRVRPDPIGRDSALSVLVGRARDMVSRREGHAVVVVGEPGIGKSTLLAAFARAIPDAEVRWVAAQAEPPDLYVPFRAARRVVTQVVEVGHGSAEELRARIEAASVDAITAAAVCELCGVADELAHRRLAAAVADGDEGVIARTAAAFVARLSATSPLIIAVDDVQWADPASRTFIERLMAAAPRLPLLVVAAHRAELEATWQPRTPHARVLLERLDAAEARRVIERHVGAGVLDEETLGAVIARADGVPLWLEELSHLVASAPAHAPRAALPLSLVDSIQSRLESLTQSTRRVAELCAAIGGQVPEVLLGAAAERPATALAADLDALAARGLVRRVGMVGDARVAFRHALMESAVYAGAAGRAISLHEAVCRALDTGVVGPPQAVPELFAVHSERAGRRDEAVAHWCAAGERAAGLWAHSTALTHYQRAVDLLQGGAEDARRRAVERETRLALGRSLVAVYGLGSRQLEDNGARIMRLSQDEPVERHWLEIFQNWAVAYVVSDLGGMTAWIGLLQEYSERVAREDPAEHHLLTFLLTCARGLVHYHVGQLPQCVQTLAEARAMRSGVAEALALFPEKSIVVAPGTYSAMALAIMGRTAEAQAAVIEEEEAFPPGSPERLTAQSLGALTFAFLRDYDGTVSRTSAVLSAAEGLLNPTHVEFSRFLANLAELRHRMDGLAPAAAEALLESLWTQLEVTAAGGMVIGVLLQQAFLAEVALDASAHASGRHAARCLDVAQRAIALGQESLRRDDVRTLNRYISAEFHRVEARVVAAVDGRDRIVEALRTADDAAEHVTRVSGVPPALVVARLDRTRALLVDG